MTRRRALRATAIGSAVVAAVAVIVVIVLCVTLIRRPLPDRGGTVKIPGLIGKVTVLRDDHAVPQIYADNPQDLFKVQGYVNAQDRFFEMDLRRHITAGRLSELVGKNTDALRADSLVRTLGWRRVAEQELAKASPSTVQYLQAYADGVNAYLSGRSPSELSVSYTILGKKNPLPKIEPWTPVDSLAWLKAMAWDMRSNYDEELERARAVSTVHDVDRVDQLYPPYPYSEHDPIIPTSKSAAGTTNADNPTGSNATPTSRSSGSSSSSTGTSSPNTGATSNPNSTDNPNRTNNPSSTGNSSRTSDPTGTSTSNSSSTSDPNSTDTSDLGATDTDADTTTADSAGADGSNADSTNADSTDADGVGTVTKNTGGTKDSDGMTAAMLSPGAQAVFQSADSAIKSMPDLLGEGEGIGSNSWVVSGDLTSSGLPLLANDPHLKVSMPGVWDQVGLHCTTVNASCPFDVAGFGFAGMPGVVIGHNASISWGLTNLYPDVTDFYLERIAGNEVETDGTYRPITTRTETVAVAGQKSVPITIRSTAHGPIISDVLSDVAAAGETSPVPGEKLNRDTNYAVSLDWTALRPGRAMDAILNMDVATNFAQFRTAALKLDAPAQNLIYADTDGNIGYQAPGRIPIRGPGRKNAPVPSDGTWPHPGWDSAYNWKGYVPVRQLPYDENPKQGFIVAANQAVTGPNGSAVKITTDWDYGYRSQRIRDLLEKAKKGSHPLTVQDMRVIQNDTYNGIAAVLVPLLLKTDITDSFTKQAVDLLKGWDYTQPTDSAAAAYFNTVWVTLLNLTFSDELPDGYKPDGGDRWFAVVQNLLKSQRDQWWDDKRTPDVVESRDEVLRRALTQARLTLTSTLGKDPSRWRWGRLHQLTLEQEPLGGSAAPGIVHKLVNKGPYQAPGGSSIVNAFSWDASTGTFDVVTAPSMRMIVDLSNLDDSRWVNQTGESGHPGDAHYGDQINTWLHGGDYAWPFTATAIRAAKEDSQTFIP